MKPKFFLCWPNLFLLFLGATSAFVFACYQYIQIPIDIQYEKISPPYLLQIENATTGDLIIEPNGYGRNRSFPEKTIQPNEIVKILLQVRKFKVSPTDLPGSNEVVSGPYIENAGAKTAVVKFKNGVFYNFYIDLDSAGWFTSVESSTPTPRILEVRLEDFNKSRWFIRGPDHP